MKWTRSRRRIAKGERIYAIGDIHGCLDLFAGLLVQIEKDAHHRRPMSTKIIIIGDFVDRGPNSADVMSLLYDVSTQTNKVIVLRGNHEQVMLQALRGDLPSFEAWMRFGGDATLRSWGIEVDQREGQDQSTFLEQAISVVPAEIVHWLSFLPFTYQSEDYFYVHAGIRPGISLKKQSPDDLLWIGSDFLDHNTEHPALIVHGHSIAEFGPEILHNRIGIDTGAYRTGRLSAVGFEGSKCWVITHDRNFTQNEEQEKHGDSVNVDDID